MSGMSMAGYFAGGGSGVLDFDAEAQKLFKRLNIDPSTRSNSLYAALDPIWRHPTGGGTIYVGNQTAAESLSMLTSMGIRRVVNCTHGAGAIPNYHAGTLAYYTFPISQWSMHVKRDSSASVLAFSDPMFKFIEDAISRGENVLVHCLAGAHRAGTTGCACLVHFAKMNVPDAIRTAKTCRRIIDPIGQLPEFLARLFTAESERDASRATAVATTDAEISAGAP